MKISDMDVGMELLFMERVLGPQVGLRDDGLVANVALAAPIESHSISWMPSWSFFQTNALVALAATTGPGFGVLAVDSSSIPDSEPLPSPEEVCSVPLEAPAAFGDAFLPTRRDGACGIDNFFMSDSAVSKGSTSSSSTGLVSFCSFDADAEKCVATAVTRISRNEMFTQFTLHAGQKSRWEQSAAQRSAAQRSAAQRSRAAGAQRRREHSGGSTAQRSAAQQSGAERDDGHSSSSECNEPGADAMEGDEHEPRAARTTGDSEQQRAAASAATTVGAPHQLGDTEKN